MRCVPYPHWNMFTPPFNCVYGHKPKVTVDFLLLHLREANHEMNGNLSQHKNLGVTSSLGYLINIFFYFNVS